MICLQRILQRPVNMAMNRRIREQASRVDFGGVEESVVCEVGKQNFLKSEHLNFLTSENRKMNIISMFQNLRFSAYILLSISFQFLSSFTLPMDQSPHNYILHIQTELIHFPIKDPIKIGENDQFSTPKKHPQIRVSI